MFAKLFITKLERVNAKLKKKEVIKVGVTYLIVLEVLNEFVRSIFPCKQFVRFLYIVVPSYYS